MSSTSEEMAERSNPRSESMDDVDDSNKMMTGLNNSANHQTASKNSTANRNKTIIRIVIGLSILAVIIVLIVYVVIISRRDYTCKYDDIENIKPRNFDDPEVFDDLTPDEYTAVREFMQASPSLGITTFNMATVDSSYILLIDLFLPDKDEVIRYLDNGGTKPERRALVIVIRGDVNEPRIEEYVVSPLPKPRKAGLYKNPSYKRDPIPFSSRPMDTVNYKPFFRIIVQAYEQLYPLLMESYGRCYHNCTKGDNCLVVFDTAPRGKNSGERKTWIWTFQETEGYYNYPLGLEMRIEHKSTNISEWYVELVVYNGQAFDTVDALLKAYREKTLKMIHIPKKSSEFSSYNARGSLPEVPKHGPRLIEPDGKRFNVHGQRVTYGKWEFYFHIRPTTGLQIYNLKFNGERIAYEISLQEVLVFYTGYGPTQSNTDYYDVSWFLGATNMELVRGVDCPETAAFVDSYFLANTEHAKKYKNNICIFENNGAIPLRRHYQNNYDDGFTFYGGISDYHLIIRTAANVWNYDYIFDYIFYTNGAVEVKSSATGYVQATFALPEERPYGNLIHDHFMADLHVHAFTYKVDLDVGGLSNKYKVLDIGLETVNHQWHNGAKTTQLKITENLAKTETKGLPYKAGMPQYHLFESKSGKNRFGTPRAYRILNKSPLNFLLADLPITRAANFAKYPIIVTKRKETERDCSNLYAQHEAYTPVLDFEDFINDENLVDEDLVAWVTMGTHHVPGTEDVPSTPTTWNQYSFFLNPHNYFNDCPSLNSADNLVIRPGKGKTRRVSSYGRKFEPKCIPKSKGPQSFDGFRYSA